MSGSEQNAFFTEPAAYEYFKFLHDERAPATRAAGMQQAFLFLGVSSRSPSMPSSAARGCEGLRC